MLEEILTFTTDSVESALTSQQQGDKTRLEKQDFKLSQDGKK
jgi:hypothetical protein